MKLESFSMSECLEQWSVNEVGWRWQKSLSWRYFIYIL